MTRSGGGPPDGPFVTPPPAWGDDPTASPRRNHGFDTNPGPGDGRSSGSAVLVVTLVAIVLIIAAASLVLLGGDSDGATWSRADPAAGLEVPPSERDQPTTTGELDSGSQPVAPGPDEAPVAGDPADYTSLDCVFVGTALVEPAIGSVRTGPHRMRLDEGANFECVDDDGAASGSVALDVEFDQLDLFEGTGRGAGRIDWDTVPPSRLPSGTLVPDASTTDTEVELLLPQIIVWITILEGPFEGFRGKLVLEEWDLHQDPELDRTEVIFERTGFGFEPRTT